MVTTSKAYGGAALAVRGERVLRPEAESRKEGCEDVFGGSRSPTRLGRRHGAAVPANAQVRVASGHGRGKGRLGETGLLSWGLGRPRLSRRGSAGGSWKWSDPGGMPRSTCEWRVWLGAGKDVPDGSRDLRGCDYLLSRLSEGKVASAGYNSRSRTCLLSAPGC